MKYVDEFLSALAFLTRIPVPHKAAHTTTALRNSARFFPLVGTIIGTLLAGTYVIASGFFPTVISCIGVVIANILITGGMHYDGFADFFDGYFGGATKEKRLAIMKDSRLGAFATLALTAGILLSVASLVAIPTGELLAVIFIIPIISRSLILYPMGNYAYAKETGLGRAFEISSAQVWWGILFGGTLSFLIFSLRGLAVIGVLFGVNIVMAERITKKLGGLTGDIYGLFIVTNEILAVLLFVAMLKA